jgi:hypothetical protein
MVTNDPVMVTPLCLQCVDYVDTRAMVVDYHSILQREGDKEPPPTKLDKLRKVFHERSCVFDPVILGVVVFLTPVHQVEMARAVMTLRAARAATAGQRALFSFMFMCICTYT